jgi:CHAT domain-containing protein/predicted negative regulator of RcsB-dependent stress response
MPKLTFIAALAQIAAITTPATLAVTPGNHQYISDIIAPSSPAGRGLGGEVLPQRDKSQSVNATQLLQQGLKLYQTQQFPKAVEVLQQAAQAFKIQGDVLNQAYSLNYVALVYQQLGQLPEASKAIASSVALMPKNTTVRAQGLNIQGQIQLALGQSEAALASWIEATALYSKNRDSAGEIGSKINQAQALQSLGLYRRAIVNLNEVERLLQQQPDSLLKAKGMLSLGNALRVVGLLDQTDPKKAKEIDNIGSRQALEQSLAIASQLNAPQLVAEIHISLGNTALGLGKNTQAMKHYQEAAASASPMTRLEAQMNQLRLPNVDYQTLQSQIQSQLATLPPSRKTIYAQISFAGTIACFQQRTQPKGIGINPTCPKQEIEIKSENLLSPRAIADIVVNAVQQARSLGDKRAEAYGLGTLGGLYEQTQQWDEAQKITQQALAITESIQAPDIGYRWQWQLGRILKIKGNNQEAIAAYSKAVDNLKSLRNDLVAINRDVQFSFTEGVEPIYRELVSLLLQPEEQQVGLKSLTTKQPSQEVLTKARDVIESLQLAELDNFFRRACIDAKPVNIDQVDRTAAVIYPVILLDRIEIIVSVPSSSSQKQGQTLSRRTILLDKTKVEKTIEQLRQELETRSSEKFLQPSQEIYKWIIQPIEPELANRQIKNLVFVLDGSLRSLPMGALHDGKHYLVEKYNIALTPGLQLLNPQPLERTRLRVIAAGLSEGQKGFLELPGVRTELKKIHSIVPNSQVLLNQEFTSNAIGNAIKSLSATVVHLATHGKFSSKAEETFILTHDGRLNVNDFNNLLKTRESNQRGAIELLVLSACTTASGDSRAALGIAGVAVRSGARSTLASLWDVDDEATALIMGEFYKNLNQPQTTKAEAFKQAQLMLLKNPKFEHPYYWAPYVLVGNWL